MHLLIYHHRIVVHTDYKPPATLTSDRHSPICRPNPFHVMHGASSPPPGSPPPTTWLSARVPSARVLLNLLHTKQLLVASSYFLWAHRDESNDVSSPNHHPTSEICQKPPPPNSQSLYSPPNITLPPNNTNYPLQTFQFSTGQKALVFSLHRSPVARKFIIIIKSITITYNQQSNFHHQNNKNNKNNKNNNNNDIGDNNLFDITLPAHRTPDSPAMSSTKPSKPRRAATAVLVAKQRPKAHHHKRPQQSHQHNQQNQQQQNHHPGDFRVLMVKRSARTSFMKDLYVFPGGSVDHSDYPTHPAQTKLLRHAPAFEGNCEELFQIDPTRAFKQQFSANHPLAVAYAYRSCAFREIFEETSLLATPAQQQQLQQQQQHPAATATTTATAMHCPVIAPLDIDQYLALLENNTNHTTITHHQQKFHLLTTLSRTLNIPVHEALRRIVHLNDQDVLKTITASLDQDHVAKVSAAVSNKEYSLLDVCIGLGLGDSLMGSAGQELKQKQQEEKNENVEQSQQFGLLDTLTPIAKWVAPTHEKKRFDTLFYLGVIDTESLGGFKCLGSGEQEEMNNNINNNNMNNNNNNNLARIDDNLDKIMHYFHKLSILPTPEIAPSCVQSGDNNLTQSANGKKEGKTAEEEQQKENEALTTIQTKLSKSTLGQEISDIRWLTPLEVLTTENLKQISLAPPTQYLLSQLSSLSYDEMLSYVSKFAKDGLFSIEKNDENENNNNNTKDANITTINPHLPYTPTRFETPSIDPYTIENILAKKTITPHHDPNNNNNDNKATNNTPHFGTFDKQLNNLAIKTKGHVVLPQDFEHPLTQQVLLHLFDVLEAKNTNNNKQDEKQDAKQQQQQEQDNEYTPYYEYTYEALGLTTKNAHNELTKGLSQPKQVIDVLTKTMSPLIPLSFVHNNILTPLEFYQQQKEKSNNQNNNQNNENDNLSSYISTLYNNNPVIQRYNQSSENVKAMVQPLIHYHRIVDSFEHQNWEILVSNQNNIKYGKEFMQDVLKQQQQQEQQQVLPQEQVFAKM